MKKLKIFDSEVLVKDYYCTDSENSELLCDYPSLRLYVKLTDKCIANCNFCVNKCSPDYGKIDIDKLMYVINYLYDNRILSGVSFTGGEPLLEMDLLFKIIDKIYEINPEIEVQINTSGYNLRELANYDQKDKLESIHISHHHYNEEINQKIFGSKLVANGDDIMYLQDSLIDKKIININTIIMKGYIDTLEEIKKNLDYVGDIGVYKNGFISLIKCNDFSKEHFLNFNDMFTNLDKDFFKGHHFYSKKCCECQDGIYLSSNNKFVEFYARMVKECNCPYVTQLVYTSDNRLTKGFGKEEIDIPVQKVKKLEFNK